MYENMYESIYDEIVSRYGNLVEEEDEDPVWAGVLSGFEMDEESCMRG